MEVYFYTYMTFKINRFWQWSAAIKSESITIKWTGGMLQYIYTPINTLRKDVLL